MTETHVTQQQLRDSEGRTNDKIGSLVDSVERMGEQIGKIYSAISHNKEDYLKGGGKLLGSAFAFFVVLFGLIIFFANIMRENIELRGELSVKELEIRIVRLESFAKDRHKLNDDRF